MRTPAIRAFPAAANATTPTHVRAFPADAGATAPTKYVTRIATCAACRAQEDAQGVCGGAHSSQEQNSPCAPRQGRQGAGWPHCEPPSSTCISSGLVYMTPMPARTHAGRHTAHTVGFPASQPASQPAAAARPCATWPPVRCRNTAVCKSWASQRARQRPGLVSVARSWEEAGCLAQPGTLAKPAQPVSPASRLPDSAVPAVCYHTCRRLCRAWRRGGSSLGWGCCCCMGRCTPRCRQRLMPTCCCSPQLASWPGGRG